MDNKTILHKAIIAYYGMNDPIMTDEEFDALFDKEYGEDASSFAIYQNIYSGNNRKRTLKKRMLSLSKSRNEEDIDKWLTKIVKKGATKVVMTPKFDGLACLVETDNKGNIVSAVTRGNGSTGEDITYVVDNIPDKNLPSNSVTPVEICMDKENLSAAENITGKTYSHVRNAAAGLVRMSNHKTSEAAKLLTIRKHFDDTVWEMDTIALPVSADKVVEKLDSVREQLDSMNVLTDGVVLYAMNDDGILEDMGDDGARPRWATAWKYDNKAKPAVIKDIIWQKGRIKDTPVAVFDPPVIFDNVFVTRATLHNQDFIDSMDIQVGDTVSLIRSNEVIPYVQKVIRKGAERFKAVNNSEGDIMKPLAKNMMNVLEVYGVGPSFQDDFVSYAKKNHPDSEPMVSLMKALMDVYSDESNLQSFKGMDKKESAKRKNAYYAIRRSVDSATPAQWIASLGIRGIGIVNAEKIIKHSGGIDDFLNDILLEDMVKLRTPGISDKTLAPIIENRLMITEVFDSVITVDVVDEDSDDADKETLSIVLTGTMDMKRSEAENLFRKHGYDVIGSVNSKASALVTSDMSAKTTKMTKAKMKGIPIVNAVTVADAISKLDMILRK